MMPTIDGNASSSSLGLLSNVQDLDSIDLLGDSFMIEDDFDISQILDETDVNGVLDELYCFTTSSSGLITDSEAEMDASTSSSSSSSSSSTSPSSSSSTVASYCQREEARESSLEATMKNLDEWMMRTAQSRKLIELVAVYDGMRANKMTFSQKTRLSPSSKQGLIKAKSIGTKESTFDSKTGLLKNVVYDLTGGCSRQNKMQGALVPPVTTGAKNGPLSAYLARKRSMAHPASFRASAPTMPFPTSVDPKVTGIVPKKTGSVSDFLRNHKTTRALGHRALYR